MTRASGLESSAEIVKVEAQENDQQVTQTLPDEDAKKWRTPGFQRMRLDWRREDKPIIEKVRQVVESRLQAEFADAYRLIYEIFDCVREPEYDDQGNPFMAGGLPVWKRDQATGRYIEDYSRMTHRQREDFMFSLTTNLFDWQQKAADAWGGSMFAKAMWEERFAIGYDSPHTGTIEDRTAKARLDAREERYFAIMLTLYSKKADALVHSLELITQRLKDAMTLS